MDCLTVFPFLSSFFINVGCMIGSFMLLQYSHGWSLIISSAYGEKPERWVMDKVLYVFDRGTYGERERCVQGFGGET